MGDGVGEDALATPPKRELPDQLRQALRWSHSSRRTQRPYCPWVRRCIFFHKVHHPAKAGEAEINAFLTHLAVKAAVQ